MKSEGMTEGKKVELYVFEGKVPNLKKKTNTKFITGLNGIMYERAIL